MLSLAQQREELSIIDDQIGAPTSAELIADITAQAIPQTVADANKVGIYHLVASGETSWFGYANYAFAQARTLGQELAIQRLTRSQQVLTQRLQHDHNSRLDNQKIQRTFGLTLPVWQEGVKRALMELLNK